ncbi:MAG: hypothetical protein CSA07_02825 [Bacteroidia bacterium]|nr:MAG: hypothetical protein CSA07_02825 [Bacteroidia bacterium]
MLQLGDDPKRIYRSFHSRHDLASLEREDGSLTLEPGEVHWTYCGVGADFRHAEVQAAVDAHLPGERAYLCISRGDSALVARSAIAQRIGEVLGKKEVGVMDEAGERLMFFTKVGVYERGVYVEYPKSREREAGSLLQVGLHANMSDGTTGHVLGLVDGAFERLEQELARDYGGSMEHLWIDLELVEHYLEDGKGYPFRFQKRVSAGNPYYYNVGHYSVVPDFGLIRSMEHERVCPYVLGLMYESTEVLVKRARRLGGFDAQAFRRDFREVCRGMGYTLGEDAEWQGPT